MGLPRSNSPDSRERQSGSSWSTWCRPSHSVTPRCMPRLAATLSDMSTNRFWLGLGTGWMEEEHRLFGFDFPDTTERFLMLEEALGYLDALKHGNGFEGRLYNLESFGSAPPFRVPIVVGGSGLSKTPALAGTSPVSSISSRAKPETSPADRALPPDRDSAGPEPVRCPADLYLHPGRRDGPKAAIGRPWSKQAALLDREPDQLEGRLTYRGIPHGTRDQVTDQMGKLADLGMSRIYLQCATTEPAQLEELVAPYLP